jgi:hypothetical protein
MSVSEILSQCTGFQWDQHNAVKNWSEAPAYFGPPNNGIVSEYRPLFRFRRWRAIRCTRLANQT